MEPKTSSPVTNRAPPSVLDRDHLDSAREFMDEFNKAMTGVLARNGSPYEQVFVLFLRWEDDVFLEPGVNNGIQGEIDQLEQVLTDDYGFTTEIYLIPKINSQRSLQKKIFEFQDDHDSRSELLLVYYGGHGELNDLNQSIWQHGDGPSVDWYSIQHLLEYAVPDVAIILDCCYAASADRRSVDGTIEILAACCRNSPTVGISEWSFTSRLIEVLKASKDKPLTIALLHAQLVNYRGAKGWKKLLKTPVYSIMSSKAKASIRLVPVKPGSIPPPAPTTYDVSQQSFLDSPSVLDEDDTSPTRVLVAVNFRRQVPAAEDWIEWFSTHMPSDIVGLSLIRTEGLWGSHSTLGLFSMPVSVWDLFPYSTAYQFVGHVKTPNMLSKDPALISGKDSTHKTTGFKAVKNGEDDYVPKPDTLFPVIRHDDIVIAVVGRSGSGKSSFIAKATGKAVKVGISVGPCTQHVHCCSLLHQGRKFQLIDTPGADSRAKNSGTDSGDKNFDAYNDLKTWFERCYLQPFDRVNVMIFVAPLNRARKTSNFGFLSQMAQSTTTYLLTTFWDIIPYHEAKEIELGLIRDYQDATRLWGGEGEHSFRFDGTRKSALAILTTIESHIFK